MKSMDCLVPKISALETGLSLALNVNVSAAFFVA